MPEGRQFSHISVSSDDDVVIEAGAVGAVSQHRPSSTQPDPHLNDAQVDDVHAASLRNDNSVEEAHPTSAEAFGTLASASAAKASARRASKHDDGYRETTLEDLENTRMGGLQKAVLAILALVFIILILCFAGVI